MSTTGADAVRSVKPTRLDLARGDSRVIVAMGPVRVPTVSSLTADLLRLGWISAGNRLGIIRVPGSRTWHYDPNLLLHAVLDWHTAFPDTVDLTIQEKLALLHSSEPTPLGLRIYIADDYLITDIPHGVFDGVMVVQLWLYLTRYQPDSTPTWAGAPEVTPHIAQSLARHIRSDPRLLIALARATFSRRHAPSTPDAHSRKVDDEKSPTSPEASTWCTRSAQLRSTNLTALRRWRDSNTPGVSVAVLLMTVLTRAMREVGVELAPHVHVVVDGRRYDPAIRNCLGNAAVGLNLPFSEPYSPRLLQDELADALTSGRPLAAMLAISFGQWMSTRRRKARSEATDEPVTAQSATVLSFSHLLGLDDMPDGAWLGGFDAHVFSALTEPADPRGIALLMPMMRDRYDLSASFDTRYHSIDRVDAALRLATEHAVSLLDAKGTESG
ncbi:hypothetical protein [Gordonia sp. NPDC003585]|uniref:hypothetical protein n=1 Tax=Gordonia sp. NPDC003585 TaxID=3154275 RepID=UPI0033BDCD06